MQATSQTSSSLSPEDRIAKIMEIFYIKPKMRSPVDRVEISGNVAKVTVWKGLPPEPEPSRIECSGYQWLLSGRGKKMGQGAAEVFRQIPEIQKVVLEMNDLEFGIKSVDKRGKFERTAKKAVYLSMAASRGAVQNAPLKGRALKDALQKNLNECLKIGRSMISEREVRL